MRLKASHYWVENGDVVIEVRDHDAKKDMPRLNPFSGNTSHYYNRKPQIATLVRHMRLPKGTSKADVKTAKKSLIMLYEIERNEVSR